MKKCEHGNTNYEILFFIFPSVVVLVKGCCASCINIKSTQKIVTLSIKKSWGEGRESDRQGKCERKTKEMKK